MTIKPTNVLVAMQDGKAAPKIIDFGVAKAINQQLTVHTLATGFAQMIGTPLYMSPEQAELSPLGVDTRSDIYSLGVLLYELLTGTATASISMLHSHATSVSSATSHAIPNGSAVRTVQKHFGHMPRILTTLFAILKLFCACPAPTWPASSEYVNPAVPSEEPQPRSASSSCHGRPSTLDVPLRVGFARLSLQ